MLKWKLLENKVYFESENNLSEKNIIRIEVSNVSGIRWIYHEVEVGLSKYNMESYGIWAWVSLEKVAKTDQLRPTVKSTTP